MLIPSNIGNKINIAQLNSKMKNLMVKLTPGIILKWYTYIKSKIHRRNIKEIFTKIYVNNNWNSSESISGTGSEIQQTLSLVKDLNRLLVDLKIKSMLDIPCGDFNWMRNVDLSKIDYVGADIVDVVIKNNIIQHKQDKNLKFKVLNLISDPLPESDIIIVRDCLVHFSFKDIKRAIKNIKSSKSRYLLTTTFTEHYKNHDIITGNWRPLNLQKKPFKFSSPIHIINENCTEGNGAYRDKSMALWEITQI